jgi:hypothetical protein
MFAILFLVAAESPTDPTLEDAKRFAQYDRAVVTAKEREAGIFGHFLIELGAKKPDDSQIVRDRREQVFRTARIYEALLTVLDPQARDSEKLYALRKLKELLGAKAFQRGEVPPHYPTKYENDFKAWLKKKKDTQAVKKAQREEEEKKQREQQKK